MQVILIRLPHEPSGSYYINNRIEMTIPISNGTNGNLVAAAEPRCCIGSSALLLEENASSAQLHDAFASLAQQLWIIQGITMYGGAECW